MDSTRYMVWRLEWGRMTVGTREDRLLRWRSEVGCVVVDLGWGEVYRAVKMKMVCKTVARACDREKDLLILGMYMRT